MKYLMLIIDGAGDRPHVALDGKTPIEAAKMMHTNEMAHRGIVGHVDPVPTKQEFGSDAAILCLMGYDPQLRHAGRAAFEAIGMGVEMADGDVAFRTSLITLEGDGAYEDLIIADHSADNITTEEASQLIDAINEAFADEDVYFYKGDSFRHCMVDHTGSTDCDLIPPHEVIGQQVAGIMPEGEDTEFMTDIMKKSYDILKNHPVNINRIQNGLNPANSIWIWGPGDKPELPSFYEKYGINGAVISATSLVKGIGKLGGLEVIQVDGADGTVNTNYRGKAAAAINAYKDGLDLAVVHIEGPDECAHGGRIHEKVECLSRVDQRLVGPVIQYLREAHEEFKVLVVPDHNTITATGSHSVDAVPFMIYDSFREQPRDEKRVFSEACGREGMYLDCGYELADYFFTR